jgi:3-hydroxyisobutyrate dehydrogenase-like beta-hydroxyacid dehydrogenase
VLAASPAETITAGGVVVTALWDGEVLEHTVTTGGFLERLGAGGVHISTSTVAPETSKRLAALHARHGATLVEAPIFGRPDAAAARQLWIPVAGPAPAVARVRPVLEAIGAQGIFDFGDAPGAALTVKLAGNFLIISAARSLAEALSLAARTGVDPKAMLDMLTTTLFPAPIYRSYGQRIIEDPGSLGASAIPRKDLGLFQDAADAAGAATPIVTALRQLVQ